MIRALGRRASGPPEVVIPQLRPDATVSALIRHATSRSLTQIMRHDPGVRLGEDPEDVHQFRVATRRLRSDLRTFAPLLDPKPVSELRDRLRLLGAKAGAARDTDVLTSRLRATADAAAAGCRRRGRAHPPAGQPGPLGPRHFPGRAAQPQPTTSCSTPW